MSLIIGVQMGARYSKMLRIMDLKVITMVSQSWPQAVPARVFRRFNFFLALETVSLMWWEKQYIVSKFIPRSLGVLSSLID